MAAITSTGLGEQGLKSEFFERFLTARTYFQDLATHIPSDKASERFGFLGSVPPMRQWGTGRKSRGINSETYDVDNQKYEVTIEVDRDEISDDQTGQIRIRINEMATRAATHKDALIASLLANGHSTGFNSYDGVSFFNAAHEWGSSGSQNNILTPTAVDPDDPTTAECQTAIKAAIAAQMNFVDDQGEPKVNSADGFAIVCPPSMMFPMMEAVGTTLITQVKNVLESVARVIAFPRLTDTSKWFLLKVNEGVRPFIFLHREPIEFKAREMDSDEGFKREVFLYGVRARYAMTYGEWAYAISNDFTGS